MFLNKAWIYEINLEKLDIKFEINFVKMIAVLLMLFSYAL